MVTDPAFDEMTPTQRIRHVQKLWDRIAANPDLVPVTDDMRAALDRRLADHRANPAETVAWGELKARSRRRR